MNRRPSGLTLHLPHLDGEAAWMLVTVLDALREALCRNYADAMADFRQRRFPDLDPPSDAEPYRPLHLDADPGDGMDF